MPTQIFTSPLVRCVETADFVAKEFGVSSLQVEARSALGCSGGVAGSYGFPGGSLSTAKRAA